MPTSEHNSSQRFLVLVQSFSTCTFSRAVAANAGYSLTQTFIVTELIGYREARKFCRSLFLGINDFFCFAGTNFFAVRNDRFFLMGIIFCDFQKLLSYQHIRQLILFNGFYWVRAIEIHGFEQYYVEHTRRERARCIPILCKGLTIILLEGGWGIFFCKQFF